MSNRKCLPWWFHIFNKTISPWFWFVIRITIDNKLIKENFYAYSNCAMKNNIDQNGFETFLDYQNRNTHSRLNKNPRKRNMMDNSSTFNGFASSSFSSSSHLSSQVKEKTRLNFIPIGMINFIFWHFNFLVAAGQLQLRSSSWLFIPEHIISRERSWKKQSAASKSKKTKKISIWKVIFIKRVFDV